MDEPFSSLSFPIATRQEHRLVFTRDVFAPENLLLAQLLTPREPGERVRALVFWDRGLEKAFPGFETKLTRWFEAQAARVELAAQDEFDHAVVNRDVAAAAQEVVELMEISNSRSTT